MKKFIRNLIPIVPQDDPDQIAANLQRLQRLRPTWILKQDHYILQFIEWFVDEHGHVPGFNTVVDNFERAKEVAILDRLETLSNGRPALTRGDFVRALQGVFEKQHHERLKSRIQESANALVAGDTERVAKLAFEVQQLEADHQAALLGTSSAPAWVTLAEIPEASVSWLWPGRIPAGELTLMEGPGGSGKSTVARYVAAYVTGGIALPGAPARQPGRVVWLTSEEDIASVLAPRLRVAGCDPERVTVRAPDTEHWTAAEAAQLAEHLGPGDLLVIDALKDHLPGLGKGGDWAETEVRAALRPLVDLAHSTGCSVLGIRHWRKGAAAASERGAGSVAYRNVARATLVVGALDGQGYLAVDKCSLGEPAPALPFTLEAGAEELPVLRWGEPASTITADDLATARALDREERSALEGAIDVVRSVLSAGPVESARLKAAVAEAGISNGTLGRARSKLGVRVKKVDGKWVAMLPDRDRAAVNNVITLVPSLDPELSPEDIDNILDDAAL